MSTDVYMWVWSEFELRVNLSLDYVSLCQFIVDGQFKFVAHDCRTSKVNHLVDFIVRLCEIL